jgi:hypothetical protein
VTRTGALWAGSIGHARFRIHVPVEAHRADAWLEGTGLSIQKHIVEINGKRVGELLLEAKDWNPTRDITFSFNAQYMAAGEELITFYQLQEITRTSGRPRCSEAGINAMLEVIGAQAESKTPVQPSPEMIERLVREGFGFPEVCRSFVYALHGKRFEDNSLNAYFYGLGGFIPGAWPFGYMTPNPNYSDAMITEYDKAGFRLVDAMVKRLAPCEACKPCEAVKAAAPVRSSGCQVVHRANGGSHVALFGCVTLLLWRRARRRFVAAATAL